jgi:hypothetical protein
MTDETIRKLLNYLALATMLAGLFGMLYCLPVLWSGRMEDLVGAGFPFVVGAVLWGTGLLTLGFLNRRTIS